jgi:CRP-like cAMP-binding protein
MDALTLLQSVPIFAETPVEALIALVDLLDEVEYKAGSAIFVENEWGTSLYIIIEGHVRVHRGGRTLTELKASEVFGEMAALEPEPRSASATAVEDTRLFRLEREPLFALCDRNPTVMHGIVRNLCRHLRASTRNMVADYLYIQQVNHMSAAAADVERAIYKPESLDDVSQRSDELGQLARVFQQMIREVHLREQKFQQELQHLRIEIDEAKAHQQVQQVTETDFFQQLQNKARELRLNRGK